MVVSAQPTVPPLLAAVSSVPPTEPIGLTRMASVAQITFREPTAWESYRGYIILAIGIIAVQLLLIAALLTQRAQLHQAEQALRDREATLRASYERSRLLAGRLINAQEAARASIARDLHDDLCQELAAVSIAVSCLKRSSGDLQDPRTRHALSMLHRHIQDVADEVRNLSHALHPASLRLFGLAEALRGHCVEVERLHDVQVGFAVDGDLAELSNDIALCLFRIAQEALRNGIVHGDARRLVVSLVRSEDSIELNVADDGRGFDLAAVHRDRHWTGTRQYRGARTCPRRERGDGSRGLNAEPGFAFAYP